VTIHAAAEKGILDMPNWLAMIVGSALISAAVLAHAYLTRPPQYELVQSQGLMRLDRNTGDVIPCWPIEDNNSLSFHCSTQRQ
jgi:hypothetical protein